MIDGRRIDSHEFDVLRDKPVGRRLGEARRVSEVFLAVGVLRVPSGVDEYDVLRLDPGRGLLEVRGLDQFPFSLRHGNHHAGAEEPLQFQHAHRSRLRYQVDGRVHVGGNVHDGDDLLRHHPVFRMVGDALELDLLVAGKDRRIRPPGVTQFIELHSGDGVRGRTGVIRFVLFIESYETHRCSLQKIPG